MRTIRRVAVPAVWLALWSVGCGESSDPDGKGTAAVGSDSTGSSTTAPPVEGTVPGQPTGGPATTPAGPVATPGGPAATPTNPSTLPTPPVTPPGMTTAAPGTGGSTAPTTTDVPTTDPVDSTPAGGAGGGGGEGGAPQMGTGGSGGSGGGAPPPEPVVEPTLITSGENDFWQIGEPTMGGGDANVTVNADQELQDWLGFGGTFNEAGWEALSHLSEADREQAIRLLFDVRDGAGFTMGRIPIGSSDYGLSRYSLNDSAMPDPEMTNFSIERDRMHLIPYIQAALAVKPDLVMWGSPWSPPPWMKSNNAYDRGNMLDDHLDAHALYLARFVEDYAEEGIDVVAIHPQNEPGYLQDYPSCGWTGEQMARYVRDHLGPLFRERLPDTQLWLGTLSNPQSDHQIGQAVVGDAGAKAFLSGVGLQWGMQQHAEYYAQQGLTIMQTEHQCGNFPPTPRSQQYESSPAPNDHAYALEGWGLLYNWITKGVNAYLAWNMVLDTMGTNLDAVRPWNQNALLVVDEDAGTLRITPTYYVFRHLAQYVEPGAKRVAAEGSQALAFKNPDGSIVTVVHNNGGSAAQTTLAVGGATLQFEVPARGWATVNWQAQ
jgi:glucosylceramidase